MTTETKADVRRALRRARRDVPMAVRRRAGSAVMRLAMTQRLLRSGCRAGFYMPAKGELDILPLLNRALWLGVHCYLPIVPGRGRRRLWFGRMGGEARHWTLNRYAIPEYGARLKRVRALALDVLFMPLLGFDLKGYRMGMGGGYYDTSLDYFRRRHHWRRPKLVGIAFEAQKCSSLPVDPWDIPLDRVLTERAGYQFRRRQT